MSRTIANGIEELYKPQTNIAYIDMVHFSGVDVSDTPINVYATNNSVAISHGGQTYEPVGFTATLPKDSQLVSS